MDPEIALEVFEIGDFDVVFYEVLDVGEEDGGGGAVLRGKGIAVGCEGGGVPLRGEDGLEGGEGVWELRG